jgi:hypothetical protein
MGPGDFATNVVVSYLATRHCPPGDPARGATTAATKTWPALDTGELDAFESNLARRLSDGRLRLVLAAQRITRNLRTTIELLQQSETKVAFHAVEVVKFADDEQSTGAYEGRGVTPPIRQRGRGLTGHGRHRDVAGRLRRSCPPGTARGPRRVLPQPPIDLRGRIAGVLHPHERPDRPNRSPSPGSSHAMPATSACAGSTSATTPASSASSPLHLDSGPKPGLSLNPRVPRAQEGSDVEDRDSRNVCNCARDGGVALRRRSAGGGVKPPQAASVKSRGGERCGQGPTKIGSGASQEDERE